MKFLVTVLSIASVASAVPSGYGAPPVTTAGYGVPLAPVVPAPVPVPVAPVAPIQDLNLPVTGPAVIEPPTLRALPFAANFAPRALPFAPLAQRLPLAPRALPLTRALPLAPAPVARALPLTRALPVAPAPVARTLNLAPAPRALPLAPAPIAPIAKALPVSPVAVPAAQPLAVAPAIPAEVPSSQFQAQDELGGFSFGYQNINSAKEEVRTPDGVTRGAYSYVDANGIVQKVEYIADPVHGFRVVGSNVPVAASAPVVDTPEVAAAKAEFQLAFDAAVARAAAPVVIDDVVVEAQPIVPVKATLQLRKKRSLTNGYGAPLAPIVSIPAPVAPIAPAVAVAPRALPAFALAARPVPLAPATLPLPLQLAATPLARVTPAVAPVTPIATPVALPKAVITSVPSSQYQARDELGGVSFGYQNENSARQEVRSPDGTTTGSYSYVDANGVTQTVNYIADALGYRIVDATNLPVAVAA